MHNSAARAMSSDQSAPDTCDQPWRGFDSSVFHVAFEAVPIGIVVCGETGTALFANQQARAIFGDASAIEYRRLVELFLSMGDLGDSAFREITARRGDGTTLPVEVGFVIPAHDAGRLIVVTVIDAGERPGAPALLDRVTRKTVRFDRLITELIAQLVTTTRDTLRFECVVTELNARFADIPPSDIDDAIVDGLRQICEAFDLDRSTWWRSSPDLDDAVALHAWSRDGFRAFTCGESARAQIPWILSQLQKGEIVSFQRLDEIPNRIDRETQLRCGTKSGVAVPFIVAGRFAGMVGFSTTRAERAWPQEMIDRLRLVTGVIGQARVRSEAEERAREARAEVRELQSELARNTGQTRREVKTLTVPRLVIADSPGVRRVLSLIESVAPTDATVLLLGETGSGKEVFAQAIHQASRRNVRPMVVVNCAAIPSTLIESELFGRERGAYTGALARQVGRFEVAHNSTIFLDEIGELSLEAQCKLLRVLQERVIERLGNSQPIKVDVRIIAATNRDLEKACADHTFREDLFYRLNVFPITVPPLRERTQDIQGLVWCFIEEFAKTCGKCIGSISKETLAALERYSWPGNVRELRNIVERAIILSKGPHLSFDIPRETMRVAHATSRLSDVEELQIRKVLESVGWRIRGRGGAAELLGLNPNTLDSRMAKLGIRRPGH